MCFRFRISVRIFYKYTVMMGLSHIFDPGKDLRVERIAEFRDDDHNVPRLLHAKLLSQAIRMIVQKARCIQNSLFRFRKNVVTTLKNARDRGDRYAGLMGNIANGRHRVTLLFVSDYMITFTL